MEILISRRKIWTAVFAAGSGNILDIFNIAVYSYFASTIGRQFFPSADPVAALMQVFAVYGIGFVMQPLGAIFFGRMAGRRGRKPVLLWTVSLMSIGTIGVGLIPTYHNIGAIASIALVALRLVQGFATGGEWGTAATYIVEWAPRENRGFFGSFQSVSTSGGSLLASLGATVIAATISPAAVDSWGWRIPFVVGGLAIFMVSIYLRTHSGETPEYSQMEREGKAATDYKSPWKLGLKAFGFTIFWTMLSYMLSSYMVTYVEHEVGLSRHDALMASNFALLTQMILLPVMGALSDRVGRKPLLLFGCFATAILIYPLMHQMSQAGSLTEVIVLECCIAALYATFSGPGPAAICEIFPTALRSQWMTSGFMLAVLVFGGFSPFMSTLLIRLTHSTAAPAFMLAPAAVITGIVILTLESSRRPKALTEAPNLP
ncbi:MFS transporter [Paraburkholderia sp. J8-2]|uniref:MFS transporter n=1 Tax=Paraburkholderia sp. J8-2 TaxID=2805440 RepID=UPI002AB69FE8|nr:MFS transporter [Paraburkholderia sp. J8-2]